MNFLKKSAKSFMAGFYHRNPKRHTNLKYTVDSTTNAEGDYKPIFDMIRLLRDEHKFEHVVAYIEEYRRKPLYNGFGERLYVPFAQLLTSHISDLDPKDGDRALVAFQAWAERNRSCPYAVTALAEALNQVGWLHRGGGYANTVTEEGRSKFMEYTALSKETMLYAQGLHADHWYWNYISLRNVTEDQAGIEGVLNRYDRAARHMPQSPAIYSAAVRPLLPRWGGDYQVLEAFADQCARETAHKAGEGAYSYAYSEIIDYGEDVRDLHIDRDRFVKGCKDWLNVLPSDYLATTFVGDAFLLGEHNLCLDLLESLDVFYEQSYQIETSVTLVNSISRDETGR